MGFHEGVYIGVYRLICRRMYTVNYAGSIGGLYELYTVLDPLYRVVYMECNRGYVRAFKRESLKGSILASLRSLRWSIFGIYSRVNKKIYKEVYKGIYRDIYIEVYIEGSIVYEGSIGQSTRYTGIFAVLLIVL